MCKFNDGVRLAALIAGAMVVGTSALASNGVLGQYQDLSATFDAGSGQLLISAINETNLQSMGFVREMGGAGRTALFGPGFVAEPNPASFDALLTVTNIGEGSAEVSGQIVITDVDGDVMTLGVDRHTLVFSQGEANVIGFTWWVTLDSDDSYFDGTDGGQVPTAFPLESAVMSLYIVRPPRNGDGLFHTSFTDGRASTVFALPAPGTGILMLAGAAAVSRRRRPA